MRPRYVRAPWAPGLLLTTLPLCAAMANAQILAGTPVEVVRRAVQNEVRENKASNAYFMFKDQRKTAHTSQTKLIVETRDAAAGMLVEQDGRPLTPQQQQAEEARLQNYIRNPDELARKRKQEREDADRTLKIVKALPDAFLYEADGTEPGSADVGKPGANLVRLRFRPNPDYDPPSREEQVLAGMHGRVLIDTSENRIAKIDATLEKQVAFGWGILGHLDRGGRFLVQQANVSNHEWELTRMDLSFTGKILLFKSLAIHSSDVFSDFHPVPANLTFAQGVELLHKELADGQAEAARPKPQPAGARKPDQDKNLCCNR
jgi:hypothetical protein